MPLFHQYKCDNDFSHLEMERKKKINKASTFASPCDLIVMEPSLTYLFSFTITVQMYISKVKHLEIRKV